MEFLYIMGFALLMATGMIAVAGSKMNEVREREFVLSLTDVARTARQEVLIAADVEDGYQREFILQELVRNRAYNISITGNTLVAGAGSLEVIYAVPSVTGDLQHGANTIRREGGVIFLNA